MCAVYNGNGKQQWFSQAIQAAYTRELQQISKTQQQATENLQAAYTRELQRAGIGNHGVDVRPSSRVHARVATGHDRTPSGRNAPFKPRTRASCNQTRKRQAKSRGAFKPRTRASCNSKNAHITWPMHGLLCASLPFRVYYPLCKAKSDGHFLDFRAGSRP